MTTDPLLELRIDRPVAGGRMLARHDGRVILVSGAMPGELVRARLERQTRSVAWAETVDVIEPSADRRPVACDPACGGALYAHIRYPRQRQLKGEVIADAWRRIGKLEVPAPVVAGSPETGYRLRARLHARGRRLGFFREGSHQICDPAPTGQLHADAVVAVQELSEGLGERLWDCDSLVISENVAGTERALHLIPRQGTDLRGLRLDVSRLPRVTGISAADRLGIVHLGGRVEVSDTAADLFGADAPLDAGVTWMRRPASFFQANRFLLGALVRRVLEVAKGATCLDLYAGVGLFSVALAAKGAHVIAVEGDPVSAADLDINAAPWGDALTVRSESVETAVAACAGSSPDVVIVDPPRAGLSPAALDGVIACGAPRIVYVSCDPPTQARDAARFVAAGYRMESLEAFDLFPNTPHVETVAVFQAATS